MTGNALAPLPAWAQRHKLPVRDGDINAIEFDGELIEKVDNDSGDRLRWAELQYWRAISADGSEFRLIYTIGHSLVVHEDGSACNRGVRSKPGDLHRHNQDYKDLEPCPDCIGSRELILDPDAMYEVETTWYSHTRCADAEEVLTALSRCASCDDRAHPGKTCKAKLRGKPCGCKEFTRGELTSPGRRLVGQAEPHDPWLAEALGKTRRF